jgi:hypothetical protein
MILNMNQFSLVIGSVQNLYGFRCHICARKPLTHLPIRLVTVHLCSSLVVSCLTSGLLQFGRLYPISRTLQLKHWNSEQQQQQQQQQQSI